MTDRQSQARMRAAYGEALHLLRSGRAASAESKLRALQEVAPGEVNSLRLLGVALLYQGKIAPSIEILERAVASAPQFWAACTDLARAYRAAQRCEESRSLLQAIVAANPNSEPAWLAYGDLLVDLALYRDARTAYERARLVDPQRAPIDAGRTALSSGDRKGAETIFREILKQDAGHVGALCGLAAVSLAASRGEDGLRLLQHAAKQSAHLPLIWRGFCQAFMDLGRLPEAENAAAYLLKIEEENPKNWVTLGNVYARLMRQRDALTAFETALLLNPREVRLHLTIGHLQKTLGQRQQAEHSYRACLDLDPGFAEAYSSLADLKNYVFDALEIEAMQKLDQGMAGDDADQSQLHFALGRAFEQKQEFAASFRHYAQANARRRKSNPYDICSFEEKSRRVREVFNHAFFSARSSAGYADPAPIFVVGLPRSGSTLIEQILASHPCIEGTFELPNVLTMVRQFDHANAIHDAYPEEVLKVPVGYFATLGRRYLDETRALRTDRPHFIDKMPNNFSHIGLIHTMLPKAIIIDARRHPMDSCFSAFKQFFAEGQSFSYDLTDLGRYFRCYLELMDHWDIVLPGKVLCVQYEDLVREPEDNIRRLLAHCSLQFDPACLNFHASTRPVRTASSEQVRQPLYTSGIGYWKRFETELDPLRHALGDSLDRFAGMS